MDLRYERVKKTVNQRNDKKRGTIPDLSSEYEPISLFKENKVKIKKLKYEIDYVICRLCKNFQSISRLID